MLTKKCVFPHVNLFTLIRQLKRTINQCKKNYIKKKTHFFGRMYCISMVLEIIIIKFSCISKMMSRNTFHEPQPDSAS